MCAREQSFRPLIETVRDALADRAVLLVLDNCEHVLDACVALVDTLLRSCPSLRVLATSREPLGITGETIWRVPPLQEATQLFLERARAVAPGLALSDGALRAVAGICQYLDGVPLAIELAAARTNIFSVEQIAERLNDALRLLSRGSRTAPLRHQTLRATFDWSYGLLSDRKALAGAPVGIRRRLDLRRRRGRRRRRGARGGGRSGRTRSTRGQVARGGGVHR